LAANPLARANCREGAGRSAEIASHVAFVANVMGMAGVAGAVSNAGCMLLSVFDEGNVGRGPGHQPAEFYNGM
jgi:ApbE superfamily uncharacterized protein (UPF0280 family)